MESALDMKLNVLAFLIALLLVGLGVGSWGILSKLGRRTHYPRTKSDIATLHAALRAYEMISGEFPTTEQGLEALVHRPTAEPIPENWLASMKRTISDPWGRNYHYRRPGIHNPDSFDVWSLGPDGIESDDDKGNGE